MKWEFGIARVKYFSMYDPDYCVLLDGDGNKISEPYELHLLDGPMAHIALNFELHYDK